MRRGAAQQGKSRSRAAEQMAASSKVLNGIQAVALGLSALLCLAVAVCYHLRPDSCAAVTIWPVWVWAAPGLFLVALAANRHRKRVLTAVVILWLAYLGAFAEEPRSLLRRHGWPASDWEAARRRGRALRVVSLNCAGGDPEAAAEVLTYDPDIVLLQESPTRSHVRQLAQRLFGREAGLLWRLDTAIISRGEVRPLATGGLQLLAAAHVHLASGIAADVISVHLFSPVLDSQLWSGDSWRRQAANRRARRGQADELGRLVAALPQGESVIVGGDFNAPAGDAIYRPLKPRLHEAFAEGGIGWGNTAFNDLPLERPDEVWVSDQLRAAAVVARKTKRSDHRMVVCDLVLR